jgi:hypothetical protein
MERNDSNWATIKHTEELSTLPQSKKQKHKFYGSSSTILKLKLITWMIQQFYAARGIP